MAVAVWTWQATLGRPDNRGDFDRQDAHAARKASDKRRKETRDSEGRKGDGS